MGADLKLLSPVGPELRPEWDSRLVMDVALNTSNESICEEYQITHAALERILENPAFVMAVGKLRKELEKEGATFKLKAQHLADHYLQQLHELVTNPEVDSRVRLRGIENAVRWAGFDAPAGAGPNGMGGFSISINLGEREKRGAVTIEAT